MRTTRGWYIFADGYMAWFNGLSRHEKSVLVSKHGMILEFRPTN